MHKSEHNLKAAQIKQESCAIAKMSARCTIRQYAQTDGRTDDMW